MATSTENKTLAKLQKKGLFVKKDGTLYQSTKNAIRRRDYNNSYKFRPTYTTGSGRHITNYTNEDIKGLCVALGYKYTTGNDAPRGGKTGDFIKVGKTAYNNIISLIH